MCVWYSHAGGCIICPKPLKDRPASVNYTFLDFKALCVKMALIFMPLEFGCNVVGKLIENSIRLEFPNV